ncbi:MAG: cbb3-type cytochrome oxidase assembly protein CcoS [Alphaproteobacteria bacterium]|nr:cbb3-type cytochrome oxidase assembly protein CcoS [Alphaproteobacteria bacterium]
MDILLILIPLAIALGAVFATFFVFAAKNGQFEDLDDPATRILHDD